MKSNVLRKCTIIFLICILAFAAAACSSDPSEDGSDINTINVTMNILYPKDSHKDNVEGYTMQVQENATVMQILEAYSNQEGIEMEVDTSGTPYVTSINEVKAKGSSGWTYEVSEDTNITKGADEYKVKDGDSIVWRYVTW